MIQLFLQATSTLGLGKAMHGFITCSMGGFVCLILVRIFKEFNINLCLCFKLQGIIQGELMCPHWLFWL